MKDDVEASETRLIGPRTFPFDRNQIVSWDRLADLADPRHDAVGIDLEAERLPKVHQASEGTAAESRRMMDRCAPGICRSGRFPKRWRLSPAYDLNPVPLDVRPRVLTLAITLDDATANLDLAFEVAEYFGVSATDARRITGEVGMAVSRWRDEASRVGIDRAAIDRMASAFEHDDLRQSLTLRGQAV